MVNAERNAQERTSIQVYRPTVERLQRYKITRHETAEEVIVRALDALEREQERELERRGRKLRSLSA